MTKFIELTPYWNQSSLRHVSTIILCRSNMRRCLMDFKELKWCFMKTNNDIYQVSLFYLAIYYLNHMQNNQCTVFLGVRKAHYLKCPLLIIILFIIFFFAIHDIPWSWSWNPIRSSLSCPLLVGGIRWAAFVTCKITSVQFFLVLERHTF